MAEQLASDPARSAATGSRSTRRGLLGGSAALVGLGSCASPASRDRTVTVFAAASLAYALGKIAETYQAQTAVAVRASFGSSGAVARQVEAGAPADLVILADGVWMDRLENGGSLVTRSRVDLLGNRLVVIGATDTTIDAEPFSWLTRTGGRLAIGDPDSVPAGAYARQWLQQTGRWEAVRDHLVLATDVRAVRSFVSRGEAGLGVVYASDLVGAEAVRSVLEPIAYEQPRIVYPAALTNSAGDDAADFLDHLKSPAAMSVFRRHGFDATPSRSSPPV